MSTRPVTGIVYAHEADLFNITNMGDRDPRWAMGHIAVRIRAGEDMITRRYTNLADCPPIGTPVTVNVEITNA